MSETRRPGEGFWATALLLVVLVLYPASFFVGIWLNRSRPALEDMLFAYRPLAWLIVRLPDPIGDRVNWLILASMGEKKRPIIYSIDGIFFVR